MFTWNSRWSCFEYELKNQKKKKRIKPNSYIKIFTLSYSLTKLLTLQVWLFEIAQNLSVKPNGLPITFYSFNSSFTGYVSIKKELFTRIWKDLIIFNPNSWNKNKKMTKKNFEIMIPMKIKSPNHPSCKKYRAPSISAHHFLTWVRVDWSPISLSFWTLLLLYWCGFSGSAWKRTSYWIQPDISMHILHTVLYAFSKVLTRRICLIIKSF